MSNYRALFDVHVAEANSAVANNTTALRESFFDMHPAHVRRLLTNVSSLLGKVDLGSLKHPEYLATTSDNAAQRAVNYVAAIKDSFAGGPLQFVNNILPGLVEVEGQLSRAVGVDSYNIKQIKNLQIRALDQIVDRAEISQKSAQGSQSTASKVTAEIKEVHKSLTQLLSDAESDKKKILEVRALAEKLARGNASQNPLEKMVRDARDRFDEIAGITARAEVSAASASKSADGATESDKAARAILKELQRINEKADGILRNATQAGLAGAYKMERDRLSREQNRFATFFYGGVLLIIAYAAAFIVPVFYKIIENGGDPSTKLGESALLLVVRLVILAPMVWALIFTNKRHSNLEILQMDYAAKAATALAYSGYKEEMDDDSKLSTKLRDGLVVRFVEHPERLLHKNQLKESVGFDKDGVTYSSTAAPITTATAGDDASQDQTK